MKCLKCDGEMEIKKEDISNDFKNKKEYKRTLYCCKECDIWITIEIPK